MISTLATFVTTTAGMSWLLACSLKASLLLAASWLGAALLRRGTAAARHQLWTLGVVGVLLLPLLCWALPSLARSLSLSPSLSLLPSLSTEPARLAGAGSLDAPAGLLMAGDASGSAPAWPAFLTIVWAAGALGISLRLLRGHLAARRLARTAEPDFPESWSAALREAAVALGLGERIQLLRSETIGSPMTIGVLRPRVLLPAAADSWPSERLLAVLVHELGHVRRHDTLIQLAAQLGCALHWWNPLVWLAAARLRVEREHACDDLVLGAGIRPSSYAADLLEVARSIPSNTHAHAGASCMVDLSSTEARLHRILDATAPRRPLRARFRLAVRGLTLAGAVTLACTSSPPELPPPAAEPAATASTASTASAASLADQPARTSLGTLTVGEPSLDTQAAAAPPLQQPVMPSMFRPPARRGTLELSLVAAEVKRRLGALAECYERRLAASPALSGTVDIHWTIDETGKVPEACVTTDTVGDRELIACVNRLVQDGRFPAPRGGPVDVSFPFVFTPRTAIAGTL